MSRTNRNTSIDVDENGKLIARVELRSKLWKNHVKELFGTVKNPREKMRSDTEYKCGPEITASETKYRQ